MKQILTLFCALGFAASATAKHGYRIQLKFTDVKDSVAYLAHYYGKPLPTIYKTDSARFDKNGVATFQSQDSILGGIYLLLLGDKKTYFEFLLNDGDAMRITATAAQLPTGIKFEGSAENERFAQYATFLEGYGKSQRDISDKLKTAKTAADSTALQKKAGELGKTLISFRRETSAKHPGTLLATLFNALETPQVPEGKHFLPDGQTIDSLFTYTYYKGHYWDKFDFTDDRLIHTPIYDAKLDEYINRLTPQLPDSVEKEADMLLAKTRGRKELFKYTLWYLTRNAEQSKIMGMDEVFVYLVENYYMKGDAYWLDPAATQKYIDFAQKKAPNIIGNLAPEVTMLDAKGEQRKLTDVKAKYTLLLFYSPDCGHCVSEIPKIDSVYRAALKEKGVKVYAVRTEGTDEQWREFVQKYNLTDWTNVHDPERRSDYKAKYDVYSTPVVYLLDEKKIIRGKRLDHTNILSLVEFLEKKGKSASVGK